MPVTNFCRERGMTMGEGKKIDAKKEKEMQAEYIDGLNQEIEIMNTVNESLRQNLEIARQERDKVKKENQKLKGQLSDLQDHLDDTREAWRAAEGKLEIAKQVRREEEEKRHPGGQTKVTIRRQHSGHSISDGWEVTTTNQHPSLAVHQALSCAKALREAP